MSVTLTLEERLEIATSTIKRLREGDFTAEEFQNLCHNKAVQEGFESFCTGCHNYQQQLFGRTYTSELKSMLLSRIKQLPHASFQTTRYVREDELLELINSLFM